MAASIASVERLYEVANCAGRSTVKTISVR